MNNDFKENCAGPGMGDSLALAMWKNDKYCHTRINVKKEINKKDHRLYGIPLCFMSMSKLQTILQNIGPY